MTTPFTLSFNQTGIPLVRVDRRPFVPLYPMDFVDPEDSQCFVGGGCQLIYRWHDAFDVFVAVVEAHFSSAGGTQLAIPVASHLCDLYLAYQLRGSVDFQPAVDAPGPHITLPAGHRTEVYTPPVNGTLHIHPDTASGRFALAVVVPKSNWVTRYPQAAPSPFEQVIADLQQLRREHRKLPPALITPEMYAWLHLLLTTPTYPGMLMDNALNGPMVHLVEEARQEYAQSAYTDRVPRLLESARLLAREQTARMDGNTPPSIAAIAQALATTERRLRELHLRHHHQRFVQYLHACRLEEAKNRLRSELPISAIAYQLGWSEHANFSNEFKQYTGLSPSKYRHRYGRGYT